MKLNELRDNAGAAKKAKRIGRGPGSGKGKTAGRGIKGQKSRSGASIPGWFEGGQTPIHVRVPKLRGFKPVHRVDYQVVNVGRISEYAVAGRFGDAGPGAITVNGEILAAAGLVTHADRPIKVLGDGELKKKLTVQVHKYSASAKAGIEKAVKFLMPALFVMLVALVGYAAVAGDLARALDFLFQADFSKITPQVVLGAVGQAFFSVSVAMGLMIAYGSYLSREISIPRAAVIIAGADTLVALLAGLAIFPLVFANGLDPAEGPGLIFVTLPLAFGHMPAGALFGTIFFLLFIVSALTSSIAVLEPIVAWVDEHRGMRRQVATPLIGLLAWLLGLTTVFSFNIWSDLRPLAAIEAFADKNLFDIQDFLAVNIMLPLGGLLIAIFVGWAMPSPDCRDELGLADSLAYRLWRFLLRYLCPIAVGGILLSNLL